MSVSDELRWRGLEASEADTAGLGDFCDWAASRQDRLLRAAYLMTGDRQLAEDIVQEAFIKVAMKWKKIGHENPDGYVRRILYHDSVSWWRRRREVPVERMADSAVPADPDAVDRVLAVRTALAALTAKQRAVVVLRYFEDLSEREVADVFNVSVGTIKSQTSAALARLRRTAPQLREFASPQGGWND